MKRTLSVAAALTMGMLMLAAPGAAAAEPLSDEIAERVYSSGNAAAAFGALSADEQEIFAARMANWRSVIKESRTTPWLPKAGEAKELGIPSSALAGGCWNRYVYKEWYDGVVVHTGDTWMNLRWCNDNTKTTYWAVVDRGGIGYLGIRYNGPGPTSHRHVGREVRVSQQYNFSVLWASAQPCMQIRGQTAGQSVYKSSCNLS
jgi:hypothetical protein